MTESIFTVAAVKRAYLLIFVIVPSFGLAIYAMFWGWSLFWPGFHQHIAALLFLVSVPLHESLHYCGFVMLNGVDRRNVEFNFDRKRMSPYVVCKENTTVLRYKVAALLPLVVLGICPFFYGLSFHNPTVFAVSLLNISGCAGDIALYFLLLHLKNSSIIRRHSSHIGFVVVH